MLSSCCSMNENRSAPCDKSRLSSASTPPTPNACESSCSCAHSPLSSSEAPASPSIFEVAASSVPGLDALRGFLRDTRCLAITSHCNDPGSKFTVTGEPGRTCPSIGTGHWMVCAHCRSRLGSAPALNAPAPKPDHQVAVAGSWRAGPPLRP
eukprot:SAG31_NODE_826_length_11751_cov_4.887659_1_plen_152_part_00